MNINDIRNIFKDKFNNNDFEEDKSGCKVIELIGQSFIADEDIIFGTLNEEYAKKELDWYLSQSLNVYDMSNPPKIWKCVSDKDGYINSNYGWCIYSDDNYNQYKNCLRELRRNKNSRRAVMIYTRPSMHYDYNTNGMSDFICTTNTQVFIRKNKLIYVVNQRSCDAIYGFKNDNYWHRYVHNSLLKDLKNDYHDLILGDLIYNIGSLHVYEKHFKFLS